MKSCPQCQNSYPTEFVVCPQDGTALIELDSWADGSVIRGKYRILSKLGQGGMGVVYKALHVVFDELRALKVMHVSLMTDENFVKRFRHEAVITRRLQHPNAVRVDDIDEAEDGRPFIVMEYIEGRSLKSVVHEEGAMAVPRVCSISKQVAAALEAAHRLGMIHRDIKPENIVLLGMPPHEQAKVLDFGIAKIKEARLAEGSGMTLTGAGVVVGTPQYMSPEQAMGKRGDELDGRSDLYSLGVVMYQMLSGDLPFRADTTMEMLIAHMQKPPTPLGLAHPNLQIPDAMSNLVMQLLEKNPARRPANARALIEELEHVEKAPAPMSVTRISAPEKLYSPEAAARAVRESLERSSARHAPPQSVEPPAPPPPRSQPAPLQPVPPAPAPQRAAPRPAPAPARAPAAPVVAAQPAKKSGWLLWAGLAVLVVALGGGFWFIANPRRSPAPQEQAAPAASPESNPPAQQPQTATPAAGESGVQTSPATQPEAQPAAENLRAQPTASKPAAAKSAAEKPAAPKPAASTPASRTAVRTSPIRPAPRQQEPEKKTEPPPETRAPAPTPAPPPVDVRAVKAAIAMGDLYYDRGDYDSAISEYQKGLRADPTNKTLQNKIQNAKKAKAAEERLLH
jgi:serine/threonine protein kinase